VHSMNLFPINNKYSLVNIIRHGRFVVSYFAKSLNDTTKDPMWRQCLHPSLEFVSCGVSCPEPRKPDELRAPYIVVRRVFLNDEGL